MQNLEDIIVKESTSILEALKIIDKSSKYISDSSFLFPYNLSYIVANEFFFVFSEFFKN